MKRFITYFSLFAVITLTLLSIISCGGGGSPKPGYITGVARWLDPTPAGSIGLKDVTVNIWDENDNKIGSGITDEKGKFDIKNIPPGTYTVTAHAPEGVAEATEKRWIKKGVKVESDRETNLELVYQNAVGSELPEKYLK
jgi:hypothetical protein